MIRKQLSTPDSHEFVLTKPNQQIADGSPIILMLPAMGVSARFYKDLAEAFSRHHISFATIDHRGNGESNLRPSRKVNFGYREIVTIDYPTAINYLKNEFPDNPLYLMGHSLGGQLALLKAGLESDQISGIILVASGSVYYKGFAGLARYGVLAGTQFANLLGMLLGVFPGHKLGFAKREARGLIKDWAYQARTGNYRLGKTQIDIEDHLKKLAIPILAVSVANDGFAPVSAVDHLCSKVPSSTITRYHYAPPELKVDHFKWAKNCQRLVEEISSWIAQQRT